MPPLERAARETVPQESAGLNDIRTVREMIIVPRNTEEGGEGRALPSR